MTLPPINPPPASAGDRSEINLGDENQINWLDLEKLANKVIDLMKRELRLDNEREGRNP